MTDVEITVSSNGPYRVKGPIRLVDGDGNEFPVREGRTVALCRCGGSTTKPFCDGTHSRIGFAAATTAVAQADASAIAEDQPASAVDVDGDPEAPGS